MKAILTSALFILVMAIPTLAQETNRPACLEDTVAYYNCLKGGTELQRNLATTYLLGSIQSLGALELVVIPSTKSMRHLRFEFLDYVETNARIHRETPWRGMVTFLLDKYGNTENTAGMNYAKSLGMPR